MMRPNSHNNQYDALTHLRIDITEHPALSSPYEIRKSYIALLYKYISRYFTVSSVWEEYFKIYTHAFSLTSEDIEEIKNNTDNEKYIKSAARWVTQRRLIKKSFIQFEIITYKRVLFIDIAYIAILAQRGKYKVEKLVELGTTLNLRRPFSTKLIQYCSAIYSQKIELARNILLSFYRLRLQNELRFLLTRVEKNTHYESLRKLNVAVVATMSAGKSTFINTVIDQQLFPTKNEACTLKQISIADNDLLNHTIGKCSKNDVIEYLGIVNEGNLSIWNTDKKVDSVELECNILGIKNEHYSVVLHDTPGTNYSQSPDHRDITYKLLKTQPIDFIIFLINASNIATDDEKILLSEIRRIMGNRPKISILFLLNKTDHFDLEGPDNLDETMNKLFTDIQKLGFETPDIIPVSTYAAQLFKSALNKRKMTTKEMVDFNVLLTLFSKPTYDLPRYAKLRFTPSIKKKTSTRHIIMDGIRIEAHNIHHALRATGLPLVEAYIDHLS